MKKHINKSQNRYRLEILVILDSSLWIDLPILVNPLLLIRHELAINNYSIDFLLKIYPIYNDSAMHLELDNIQSL